MNKSAVLSKLFRAWPLQVRHELRSKTLKCAA